VNHSYRLGDGIQAAWLAYAAETKFDLVLADTPYGETQTINEMIEIGTKITDNAALFFMYGEDLAKLDKAPDEVLYWVKPVSTKNTKRKYSRFVEPIAVYHGKYYGQRFGNCGEGLHWSMRTGVFTDSLIENLWHPHQKPISLIQKLIANHCRWNDSVFDICAGSGTSLIAGNEMVNVTAFEINLQNYERGFNRLTNAGVKFATT
jgi:hypothetical protein